MSDTFQIGPRLGSAPRGDAKRQAVDALRGYVFQLYASALAWLELQPDEDLYLEVAEDYATTAQDALRAVQAKDTAGSGSATLNSEGVRDAIEALVELTRLNHDRKVFLRYLSTSAIGVERAVDDRVEGIAGLLYWRDVAAGKASIAPLKDRLLRLPLDRATLSFIKARTETQLLDDLVSRIEWDCGHPGIDELRTTLEETLVHGSTRVDPEDVDRAVPALLHGVLEVAVSRSPRKLTASDLTATLRAATEVSVSIAGLRRLVQSAGITPGVSVALDRSAIWLSPLEDLPPPDGVLERPALLEGINKALGHFGVAVLQAGTGYGKSILAGQTASQTRGHWSVADLGESDVRVVVERVGQLLGDVARHRGGGLILEDLDAWEDKSFERLLGKLAVHARRIGAKLVITTHREPTPSAIKALGAEAAAIQVIPPFAEEEIAKLIARAGGEPSVWTFAVQLMGSGGHPQLTQAVIKGLTVRLWPVSVLSERAAPDAPDPFVDREMTAARRRLLAAVPDDARSLLYRASLLFGRAQRRLVLSIGDVEPRIVRPGEALEGLVGPWIDRLGEDGYRVSPLVSDAGRRTLGADEQLRVHQAVVNALVQGPLPADSFDLLFLHALQAKREDALYGIARSIVSASDETALMLAENSIGLRFARTDERIFPDNDAISHMLRLAQFGLLTRKGRDADLRACIEALLREAGEPASDSFLGIALFKILMERRTAALFPKRWIEFVVTFDELCARIPTWRDAMEETLRHAPEGLTLLGMLLGVQTWALRSISNLSALFDQLGALTEEQRTTVLDAARSLPGGLSLLVNQAWAAPPGPRDDEWHPNAEAFDRLAQMALAWGERELAFRCTVSKCVMIDEYGQDPDGALKVLDDAVAEFGPDPILARERAKVLWRRKDYAAALPILETIVEAIDREGPVERAFLLREAAISAGELGNWRRAARWFEDARTAADAASPDILPMAIGLMVDTAVARWFAGETKVALELMAESLVRLRGLDAGSGLRAAYVHRLARHAALWIFGEATKMDVRVADGPAAVIAGMGSNPEPHAGIADLPLGELDIAWYLLAIAELALGVDAGIDANMGLRLAGPPITGQEPSLAMARVTSAIRKGDALGFAELLPHFVATRAYVASHHSEMLADDLTAPRRREIAPLPPDEVFAPPWFELITLAIGAFGLLAALEGRQEDVALLKETLLPSMPPDHPAADRLARMLGPAPTDPQMIRGSADVASIILTGAETTPVDLVFMSVRLIETIDGTAFGPVLTKPASDWLVRAWSRSAEQQSFLFLNPAVSARAITEAIRSSRGDLASMARIVRASLGAVRVQAPQSITDQLERLASTADVGKVLHEASS
jgi:hypothetical protein